MERILHGVSASCADTRLAMRGRALPTFSLVVALSTAACGTASPVPSAPTAASTVLATSALPAPSASGGVREPATSRRSEVVADHVTRLGLLKGAGRSGTLVASARVNGRSGWIAMDSASSFLVERKLLTIDERTQTPRGPKILIDGWGKLPDLIGGFRPLPMGLDAVLPPQLLVAEPYAVLLSMPTLQMVRIRTSDALDALATLSQAILLADVPGCVNRLPDGSVAAVSFVIPGSADGEPVRWLVDTGSDESGFLAQSHVATHLRERHAVESLGIRTTLAGEHPNQVVSSIALSAGALTWNGPVALLPSGGDDTCPHDGLLGNDILGQCTLVMSPEHLWARCAVGDELNETKR